MENTLIVGAVAILLLLIIGAAILLGYHGAPRIRPDLSHQAQSEGLEVSDGPLRTEKLAVDAEIDLSPAELPKYQAIPTAPDLCYQFENGQHLTYDVSLTANKEELRYSLLGELSYKVTSNVTVAEQTERAAGTAFVVNSEGILATCAHVVLDEAAIRVVLGEESYHAEVVALDRKSDLALLQIEASGLPALPLRTSSEVRLAQRVRLVGFPLGEIFGSSAKTSSG
ncbi:MAG: trypsin-like peptidase domain-containing protein, partial [Bythopirellula sp.]